MQGSGSPLSLDAAAATQVLTNYLGNEAESVQWDPMTQPQEVKALEQHRLKAILVSEPYIYQAESQAGAVEVLDACSGSTASLPLAGYVAMNAWVKDNPRRGGRLPAGARQGAERCVDDRPGPAAAADGDRHERPGCRPDHHRQLPDSHQRRSAWSASCA